MKLKVLFFLLFLSFISCNNNDDDNVEECIKFNTAYVNSVDASNTAKLNETTNIDVKYLVSNGCGGFNKFIESKDGNTTIVEVEAMYKGCNCTDNAPTYSVNYKFKPSNTGEHILKFKSSPTDYITVTMM